MDRWKKRVLQLDPCAAKGQVLEVEGVWHPDLTEPSLSRPVVLRAGNEGVEAPSTASLLKDLIISLGPKFEVQTVDTTLGIDGPLWTLGQWERYWRLRTSSSAAADSAITVGAPGGSSVDDEADSSSVVRLAIKGVPAAASLPPDARSLSLEVPCLSLDSSALEGRWPIPPAAAALDLCAQVWGTEDGGGPAATPGLHLSPPGGCSLPVLPPSAAGVWICALAGVQSVILVPPGGRSWAVAAGKAPDRAEERAAFCALAADRQVFRVDLRPQDILFVPPGWLHASAAPEGAISFRGAFLLAEAIATHLDARRLQDGGHRVSPTRQFPLFKQTMWRAAVVWGEKLLRLAGLDDSECQARVTATRDSWKKEAGRSPPFTTTTTTGNQRKANKNATSRGETPERRRRTLIVEDSDEEDGVQREEEEQQQLSESKKRINGASFNNNISSARPLAAADRSFPSKDETLAAPHKRLVKKKKEERAVGRHSKTTLKLPARHPTAGTSGPRLSKETNGSGRVQKTSDRSSKKKKEDAKRKRAAAHDDDDFLVSDEGNFEDGASDADWGPAASSEEEEGIESERGSGAHSGGHGGPPLRRLSARQRAMLTSREPWMMVGSYPKGEGVQVEEETFHQEPAATTGRSSARARRLPARLADTEVAFSGFQEYEEAFDDGDEQDDRQSDSFTNEEPLESGGSSFSSVQGGGVEQQQQHYDSGSEVDNQPAVGLGGEPNSKPPTLRLKIPAGNARPATPGRPVVRIKLSNRTPAVNIPQIDGVAGDDPVDGLPNGWNPNEALSGMYRELFGDDEEVDDDRNIAINGNPPSSMHTKASSTRTRLDLPKQKPSIQADRTSNSDVAYRMQPALAALLSTLKSWLESPSLLNDVPLTMDDPWDVVARLEVGMKSLQWDVTPPPTRFVAEKRLDADSDDAVLLQAAELLGSPAVIPQTEMPCLSSEGGGSGMNEQEGEAESMSDYVPDDLDEHVEPTDAVIDESDDRARETTKDRVLNPLVPKAAARQGAGGTSVRPAAAASGRGGPAAKTSGSSKKPGMSVKARLLKKLRI